MGGLELAEMADFYADLTGRLALTDSLALGWDISERLHRLAAELEDAERDSIMARAAELKGWPLAIDDQALEEDVRVLAPLPFSAPLEPGTFGAIYEIRTYTYGTGFMPGDRAMGGEHYRAAQALTLHQRLPDDRRPQKPACAQLGLPHAAERQRIRAHVVATGRLAPNTHAEGMLLREQNILTIPASFSPLR